MSIKQTTVIDGRFRGWQRKYRYFKGVAEGLASPPHWYCGRIDPQKFGSVLSQIGRSGVCRVLLSRWQTAWDKIRDVLKS